MTHPANSQLDAIWERLAIAIEARANHPDSTVIRDLSRLTTDEDVAFTLIEELVRTMARLAKQREQCATAQAIIDEVRGQA